MKKRHSWLQAPIDSDEEGASAVEFAIICPVFMMVLFGIISFGAYLTVVHGVQQLAAEAARASVGGVSETERKVLAHNNIQANIKSYPLLLPERLTLAHAGMSQDGYTFQVQVRYDASDMFIFSLPSFVPAPHPTVTRSAAIQRGGY